ncbi:MAG: DUF3098 domain-containing protein [Muribaculaceae bacterium]|nr:DUF3098 domain-containing protein [Muribaculaceae bacterium]
MDNFNSKGKSDGISHEDFDKLPLARNNFILMAIAGAMIIIGFLLMLGGSSTPEGFNPDIFSTRRIVIGPAICFLGFVAMAVAVCIKPKK